MFLRRLIMLYRRLTPFLMCCHGREMAFAAENALPH